MYRLFAYKFLADFWVIVPIIVPFYHANGLTATEIMTVQAAFSLSSLLFEIPSGYLSDVIGRRRTLIAAALFLFAGVSVYAWSNGFLMFVLAEVILGIAGALRSGTDSALLYDILRETRQEKEYARLEGRAEFWSRTGTAAGSITGGVLGAFLTLHFPFYVNMASTAAMIAIALSLREPRRERLPRGNAFLNILAISRDSVTNPRLLPLMLLSGIIISTGVTAIWGYFMFYGKTGLPLYWYGIIFAVMQMASAFGARHAHDAVRWADEPVCFRLLTAIGFLFIAFACSESQWLIALVPLHALLWGLSTPLVLDRINKLTSSDIRATTLSVSSIIGRIMVIVGGPLFGWITDHFSLGTAFGAMGVLFLAATTLILGYIGKWRFYRCHSGNSGMCSFRENN
ncbi:MAG: MFS transporter [Chitinispirillaceae bacterium]|nr:MFS transporter [Chitinispirillaceae bacterium]